MIKSLFLGDFRNYRSQELPCARTVNILVGDNGQGKTNVLEAIYFLAYLRSFRGASVQNLRRFGAKGFSLAASLDTGAGWERRLEVDYFDKRSLRLDGQAVAKSSDFVRQLKTVVFQHEDLNLVTGVAVERRRFFDIFLCSLDTPYLLWLKDYVVALKSRNAALRSRRPSPAVIAAFGPVLAVNAVKILSERARTVELLAAKAAALFQEIKGGSLDFQIRHVSRASRMDLDFLLEAYGKDIDKDVRNGFTGVGPHLDDYDFVLDGKPLRKFGSLGQCRLAALCLKMAALDVIIQSNEASSNVVALVDDVTGELDQRTRDAFFRVMKGVEQVFFTFTKFDRKEDYFSGAGLYQVCDGKIEF